MTDNQQQGVVLSGSHKNNLKPSLLIEWGLFCYAAPPIYVSGADVLDVLLLDDIWNDIGFVQAG